MPCPWEVPQGDQQLEVEKYAPLRVGDRFCCEAGVVPSATRGCRVAMGLGSDRWQRYAALSLDIARFR